MPEVTLYLCLAENAIDRPLSRVLRDRAAALYFGNEVFAFTKAPEGKKPALLLPAGAEFNVSHSKNLFVCAFSDVPVGVDVEHLRAVPRKDSIARRVFSESDLARYSAAPEAEKEVLFLKLWTRTEAGVKHSGAGIFETVSSDAKLCFTDIGEHLPQGFVGTLCTETEPKIKVVFFSQNGA